MPVCDPPRVFYVFSTCIWHVSVLVLLPFETLMDPKDSPGLSSPPVPVGPVRPGASLSSGACDKQCIMLAVDYTYMWMCGMQRSLRVLERNYETSLRIAARLWWRGWRRCSLTRGSGGERGFQVHREMFNIIHSEEIPKLESSSATVWRSVVKKYSSYAR